jgi:methyl-accepting chemotaxis protein
MLKKITEGAREVNLLVADIAVASRAQSEEIHQINNAVSQVSEVVSQINSGMDQVRTVTEQNAANSEESASVAEELSSQAKELEVIVNTFSLSGTLGAKHTAEHFPARIDFTPPRGLPL